MKSRTQHTGKLEILERLPSSRNGNPRYLIKVDGWTCRTAPDASIAYKITNYDGKMVTAMLGTYYGLCTIESVKNSETLEQGVARLMPF